MNRSTTVVRDVLVLVFASFLPLAMALVYFVGLSTTEGPPNPVVKWALGSAKVFQFAFPAAYVWCFARQEFRLAPPTARGIWLGIGFGLGVAALTFVVYFSLLHFLPVFLERAPRMIFLKLQELHCDTPLRFLALGAFIAGVHSLLEEYYWRWFVFGWMRKYLPLSPAIVLSSTGFMLHHIVVLGVYFPGHFWTLAMPLAVAVAVGGGFWAWLYEHSGSLYPSWLSHCCVDAAIMLVGYEMLGSCWR